MVTYAGSQSGPKRIALLLLTTVIGTAGCGSSVGPTDPGGAAHATEVEFELLQLANRERRTSGSGQDLVADERLSQVARAYSEEMRDHGFLSHVGPDGSTLRQRLEVVGIAFSRAGENIAQVTHDSDPASFAHDLLMSSQRHRANILDPHFRYVGIGVARTGETFWITQVFIAP